MTSPILQAVGLSVSFGGINAVRDVNLCIQPGELVSVIGPNGAGKSTLLNMICGSLEPKSGRLFIAGTPMLRSRPHEFARRGVVRKFQGTNTFQWMTVRDNLIVAGLCVAGIQPASMPSVDEILGLIRLQHRENEIAERLPHGERQWLELGISLMCQPILLLLDEPAAGMSAQEASRMAALLQELSKRFAIVVIEHDISFVRTLNCRTLVMHQGAIVRDGRFHEVERDEEIRDIYLGRAKGERGHATH